MPVISFVDALEILDSRGQPTLQVQVGLDNGIHAVASVPSGASTGRHEVVELRDNEPDRYLGRGVLAAVGAVRRQLGDLLRGHPLGGLDDVIAADLKVQALDGTEDYSRLGGNAAVGVSMALTRAAAAFRDLPVWALLGDHLGWQPRLPVPHFNVVNGGAHAANDLAFQEFMVAPIGAPSFGEALRAGAEVYAALRRQLGARGMHTGLGDEGGFAAPITRVEDVLGLLVDAIEEAGYRPGRDGAAIALDPAANAFRAGDAYAVSGTRYSSTDMVGWYDELVRTYPIWSIEDGLAEDDDAGWRDLTAALGDRVQIVGDDVFVTDARRVQEAAERKAANACLVKINQIGSLARTLETVRTCRSVGYGQMVSHRSGETTDTFIADLAVGIGCGQLKSGAPARGERVAKYNRLLEIEHQTRIPYGLTDGDQP